MSDELILKKNGRPQKAKPVGITFNTNNSRLIVLCDDGSIWEREVLRGEFGEITWHWRKTDEFTQTETPRK